jgi:hypothetical protein
MNPDPNRDYGNEIARDYQDLDPLDRLRLRLFVFRLWLQHKARRAWLRLMWGKLADHPG